MTMLPSSSFHLLPIRFDARYTTASSSIPYGVKRLLAPSESSSSNGGDVEAHAQHELVPDPDGCPEVVPLGARRLHEAACPYAPAQCPYCDASSLRRMTVAQHTRTCAHIPCPHRGVGCAFEGAEAELEAHLRACVYEGLRGFLAKYEEDRANLVRRLREQRLENMALTDTVAQLTTRLQELVTTLDAKTAHYDSVIQRLTDGQRTNIRPMGPTVLRPPSQSTVMPPAVLGRSAPPPEETDVDSHSFKLKGEFNGHDGPVWALAVNKKRQMLVSGSSDETIRIWDLATFKTRNTLVGHGGIVHAVVVVGRKLISGSSDKTIRVWNLKTMKLERTITGHGNTICKLVVEGNLLFSGSYTEIKARPLSDSPRGVPPPASVVVTVVWNVKTFACIATLKGHNHWVRALCVSNGILYSGCHNLIKAPLPAHTHIVWDVSAFRCIKNLTGHYGSIYSIAVADRYILAGTYENAIMVFDLDTFECVRALAGHMGAVYAVCIHQRRLFTGSYDNHIKVWNLDNFRCVQTLKRHTSSVEALVVDDDGLYSASSDNSIKMFS
ncbi:Rfwd1prov protein [Acanthamoeba castellanii str. Neff]|uniref:Rfwd1prov protein n=1 Tax=Acanthamoeba castellanii (strain ATCC 30010 / Neff) TaxID=1257118 RepID=L8GPG4_ACACF|nr:Rfwd1prov protein [Acanthamoeba castellanii str. Neff]ELR14807.1 Rfwd1prov protein [Acanthamoeba castellanii str. Neff]